MRHDGSHAYLRLSQSEMGNAPLKTICLLIHQTMLLVYAHIDLQVSGRPVSIPISSCVPYLCKCDKRMALR